MRRLQTQTLPDEAPPMGKIHPFSKIAVTFEPVMQFGCPLGLIISWKIVTWSILWLKAPSATVRAWRRRKDIFTNHDWINELMNQWIAEVIVEQPLAEPGSANNVGPLCNHLYKPNRPYLLVSNFKLSLEGSSKPKKIMLYKKGLIHHFWLVLTLTCILCV